MNYYLEKIRSEFRVKFSHPPEIIVSAPGRVNIIGEHTDYNDGFVMPAAIDKRIWAAGRRREDGRYALSSSNLKSTITLDGLRPVGEWVDYPAGVINELKSSGFSLGGSEILFMGNIPLKAGLSSSAAIEVVSAFLLDKLYNLKIDLKELALVCQRAESNFVGVRCGIMDQFASALGQNGKILFIDCRSRSYKRLPFDYAWIKIVLVNSMVERSLVESKYNERREESQEGLRNLSSRLDGINSLRDVGLADLEENEECLDSIIYRRLRHVITENSRVESAADLIARGKIEALGGLINESHQSLRDDYMVSCPELDLLVEMAGKIKGVLGSRMVGAGFGGCTLNLVKEECVEDFKSHITEEYNRALGLEPEVYITNIDGGVRVEWGG